MGVRFPPVSFLDDWREADDRRAPKYGLAKGKGQKRARTMTALIVPNSH